MLDDVGVFAWRLKCISFSAWGEALDIIHSPRTFPTLQWMSATFRFMKFLMFSAVCVGDSFRFFLVATPNGNADLRRWSWSKQRRFWKSGPRPHLRRNCRPGPLRSLLSRVERINRWKHLCWRPVRVPNSWRPRFSRKEIRHNLCCFHGFGLQFLDDTGILHRLSMTQLFEVWRCSSEGFCFRSWGRVLNIIRTNCCYFDSNFEGKALWQTQEQIYRMPLIPVEDSVSNLDNLPSPRWFHAAPGLNTLPFRPRTPWWRLSLPRLRCWRSQSQWRHLNILRNPSKLLDTLIEAPECSS